MAHLATTHWEDLEASGIISRRFSDNSQRDPRFSAVVKFPGGCVVPRAGNIAYLLKNSSRWLGSFLLTVFWLSAKFSNHENKKSTVAKAGRFFGVRVFSNLDVNVENAGVAARHQP